MLSTTCFILSIVYLLLNPYGQSLIVLTILRYHLIVFLHSLHTTSILRLYYYTPPYCSFAPHPCATHYALDPGQDLYIPQPIVLDSSFNTIGVALNSCSRTQLRPRRTRPLIL